MFRHFSRIFFILLLVLLFSKDSYSQNTSPHKFIEWTTWTILQAVPSPTFIQDKNENNARLQFALKWQLTPVNYSFNANKLISPVQFFKVNPVRRYGGSVELFFQPVWATSGSQYSDLKRFDLSAGARIFIPAIEYGEYLSFSLGGKYSLQKNKEDGNVNYSSVETGIYTFFGILGIQFSYNFISQSRYNFGLLLKYY